MDPREIGLCTLFCGADYVSRVVKRPRLEVEAFQSLITYETSPCFEMLRSSIVDVINSIGEEKTRTLLQISKEALKIICLSDKTNPIKSQKIESSKIVNSINKDEINRNYASAEPLRERILKLYNCGVRIKVIQCIYDLKSPALIHAIGNWTRLSTESAEKENSKREYIKKMRNDGKSDETIANHMKISKSKIPDIMGDLKRTKLFYTPTDIEDAVDFAKIMKKTEKTANELGVSHNSIKR